MTYIHSFQDVTPPARYDGLPWVNARVEEAAAEAGPFTQIASLALPVDADPSTPNPVDLTVTTATLERGWYRWRFDDAAGRLSPYTAPVFSPAADGTTTLVDRLRGMVGAGSGEYTIEGVSYWTGPQLARLLLSHRVYWHDREVLRLETLDAQGVMEVRKGWLVVNGTIDPADPGTIRSMGGSVTGWTVSEDGQVLFDTPVQALGTLRWSGFTYDLAAAAADALESWASAVQLHYDVTTDGQSMSRSQKHSQLLKQAAGWRARSLPRSVPFKAGGQ